MQQNTTDLIAKSAWEATKSYWKEFILLPLIFGIIIGLLQTLIVNQLTNGIGALLLLPVLWIVAIVFGITFFTAMLQWCAELYAGKTNLDVKAGLKYGLSRFWGVLGTGLLTGIKVMLWSLLLILPGLYKAVLYSQSIKISQLEKISGGKANKMSAMLINEVGFLRTVGNLSAINTVSIIIMYVIFAVIFGVLFLLVTVLQLPYMLVTVAGTIVGMVVMLFAMTFMVVFSNYQYLYYRDEAKDSMKNTAKILSQI